MTSARKLGAVRLSNPTLSGSFTDPADNPATYSKLDELGINSRSHQEVVVARAWLL
eukprot:CAMPEP_0195139464 /NCGR_PEP_ID=MMETSP0448-20130528/159456_1 /TAXON_ID=66468 /ORGANISM="Heterocapsa triquestra, Strain CCMP 448" /LENGTH=55 /DNA_ID=CAMNT_0040177775 /DNA_START=9 /DNA_END=172 /DNA_ORIENTATION=-